MRTVLSEDRNTVGYLGRILPALSETFVTREIAALREAGVEIKPFSLLRPDPSGVHPDARRIWRQTEVLSRPANPLFWLAHLFFAFRHPRRYFRGLWRYVIASGERLGKRLLCLRQFAVAPYAALRFRRSGVAHIHAHFSNSPGGVAMMAADLIGIPWSVTIHSYDLYVETALLPAKLRSAAFVATVSNLNVNYLRDNFPAAESCNLHVVRCGIDPEDFPPRPQPENTRPVILGVGRLVELKGFHTLIEALALLRNRGINAQCFIAGEGPEKKRLQRLVEQLGLQDAVYLPGRLMQNDLREYYKRADVLVQPSCVREYQDNIPVVLIEAMAMTIPVVSTNISAIPELVRDGETGLLVEPENPQALAGALERLIGDKAFAQSLGQAGRRLVTEEFNIRKSAARLKALFEESMGRIDKTLSSGNPEAP